MNRRKERRVESRLSGPSIANGGAATSPPFFAGPAGLTRWELVLLALVLAVGVGLRVLALLRSGVEHFDEGVYASNLYFGAPGYAYPLQRFYAPPLLPGLIEVGMMAGLSPNLAALLPSFLAGCATIFAVWWFGRTWFGPEAGLSAAALAALSDFHTALSAAALTDVLLGLWVVLAVDAIGRSLAGKGGNGTRSVPATYGDLRWAVGAGLMTGLAWWTKYNGWLPLVIEGAGLAVLWWLVRPTQRQLWRWLGCFAVTAVVAAAVWSPYFFSLESVGGYGPIAANHAMYVVGFSGWIDAAARQIANQFVIERPVSAIGIVVALALPAFVTRRAARDRMWRVGVSVGVGALALLGSSFVVVGVGAGVGLLRMIFVICREGKEDASISRADWRVAERHGGRSLQHAEGDGGRSRQGLRHAIGVALVVAWWGGLFLATPLYTPYPRLVLPWLLAAWLGFGLNAAGLVEAPGAESTWRVDRRWQWIGAMAVMAGLFFVGWTLWPLHQVELPVDRRGLMRVAAAIRQTGSKQQPRAIYVYGEPALFFQLRAAGEEIVVAVQDVPGTAAVVDGQAIATLLAVGPHARSDPQFAEQWETVKERWELVETFDYRPSAVVWLDWHDPRETLEEADDAVTVYRMRR